MNSSTPIESGLLTTRTDSSVVPPIGDRPGPDEQRAQRDRR